MERYRVTFETGQPTQWRTVQGAPPAVYAIETDGGPYAAVARAVAVHVRERPDWPIYEVSLHPRVEARWRSEWQATRYRVEFPRATYTVASRSGDLRAVAIAAQEYAHRHPEAPLEPVRLEFLSPGPVEGRGARADLTAEDEWR
jgi:hypothetical protein